MTSLIPSPSVSLVNGRPATTSLQVAEFFGKRHDHVVRDIRTLVDNCPESFHLPNFGEVLQSIKRPDGTEIEIPVSIVYRDGFMLLVMGYTGKKALQIKLAYIAAFNAMEAKLSGNAQKALPEEPDTSSRLSKRGDPERKELHALVNTWVGCAPLHYAAVNAIINAHIGVKGVDEMTLAQVRQAIEFARGKIAEAAEQKALPAPKPEPLALPSAPGTLPDHDDAYRLMREDMEQLVRKIGWLMSYMRFRGPRAVPLNQGELGNSIRRGIGDCIAALYEAQSHLADANRLALMIKQ